jgi:Type II secretion system (T2SS), protein M subtype b
MRPLLPRERMLVAIGLLIAVFAVVWLGVLSPLIDGFVERSDQRESLLMLYARNQRILAGIPVWREQAEEQKASASKFELTAPTEALAAEALKSRLNKLSDDVGGTVQSIQDIQEDVPAGWIRVRADLQLTDGQLYKCLARLESEEPYVVVEHLSIAADNALQTGHLGPMAVRIEVSAPVRLSQSS